MKTIWITREGKEIPVCEMTDSHLDNAIAMCERKGFVPVEVAYSCMEYAYSGDTPDGASMAASAELSMMKTSEAFDALLAEKEERQRG